MSSSLFYPLSSVTILLCSLGEEDEEEEDTLFTVFYSLLTNECYLLLLRGWEMYEMEMKLEIEIEMILCIKLEKEA